MDARFAERSEIDVLARLWLDGWRDGHARILPAELARYRTLESFRERLESAFSNLRVAGPVDQPLGLCITKHDEIDQLYVSAAARGSGIAEVLLTDGEQRLRASGVSVAWLTCAIGNERAERFYVKRGWRCVGKMISPLPTPDGVFPLEVLRYEKDLRFLDGLGES